MRKLLLISACLCLLIFAQTGVQAQGTRNAVLVEIFTGTWCTFCPGSAMGADDLIISGASAAIVEHHIGDAWEIPASNARDAYYSVSGYPTTYFDGHDSIVGGSATTSIFPSMNPKYLAAFAMPTPFNLTGSWTQGSGSVNANIDVEQVGAYALGNLVLHVVATESHIATNWLAGLTEINFVNRAMVPSATGTPLTISMGSTVNNTFNIPIDPTWVQAEMELVVWVQNSVTKTVYNTIVMPLAVVANTVDATAFNITSYIPQTSCMTSIAPEIRIRNNGSANLTSVAVQYSVNGGASQTYNWTGNLPWHQFATVTLPSVNFTPGTSNTLNITLANPNSTTDPTPSDNVLTATWGRGNHMLGTYHLNLQLDQYGLEVSWDLKNSSGTTMASGGPYANTNPNMGPLISEDIILNAADCYSFTMHDAFGDGLCCTYGNGSVTLTDPLGATVITGGQYGSTLGSGWESLVVSVAGDLNGSVSVYPNPSTGVFNVDMGNAFSGSSDISVVTLSGKVVFETKSTQSFSKVDLSQLASGMYMMNIKTENGVAVKKITKE